MTAKPTKSNMPTPVTTDQTEKKVMDDMTEIFARLGRARTRLALEQRLVFDAAAAATGAEVAADLVAQDQAEAAAQSLSLPTEASAVYEDRSAADDNGQENGGANTASLAQSLSDSLDEAYSIALSPEPTEVLFIDGSVPDVQDILAGIGQNVEVFILDPSVDGVEQIASILEGRTGIDAIHIISHGNSGQLDLGSASLNAQSIEGQYADELSAIGNTLSDHGDILVYGCNFGQGEDGTRAVNLLANATGADIAASDDLTGAEELGGDWDLEVEVGTVETHEISAEAWHGLLAPMEISVSGNPIVTGNGSVGTTAVWVNAGTVDGQSIDLRATVTDLSGGRLPFFGSSGDDPFFQLTGYGSATLHWEIFQSGTNQGVFAFGNPTFSVADVDGVGGQTHTRETVAPSLSGLTGYAVENGSNVQILVNNGLVEASGTQNQNGELSSLVSFTWNDVASWDITYTMDLNQAGYQARFIHDGDGDLVFINPQSSEFLELDLDANNSTATGTAYTNSFIENSNPVPVVDSDFQISQHAALGNTIHEANIILSNAQPGDQILVNGSTSPNGTVNGFNYTLSETNGQISVVLSGNGTVDEYEAAIKLITFGNNSEAPNTTDREILVSVTNDTYGTTSNAALSTITVTGVNDAPIAIDDGLVQVTEDTPVTGNVLGNDSDIDGDTIFVQQFSVEGLPGHIFGSNATATIPDVGTLQIKSDGSYTFTPAANYTGAIPTVTYLISDGNGGRDIAELRFADIENVNDAPVAVNDGLVTVVEDSPVSGNVLPNDSDPEGNILTVTGFDVAGITGNFEAGDIAVIPDVGSLQINTDGSYTFTPVPNYTGAIPVATYSITDGHGGADSAELRFADIDNVNDTPVAVDDGLVSVTEDTPVSGSVLPNDSDVDGDSLTVTDFSVAGLNGTFSAGDTAAIPDVGTLQIKSDGSYTFTPAPNYTGAIPTATYTITDSHAGSDTAQLSFADVTPVNDAPIAVDETVITVKAGQLVNIVALNNDSDPDGDPLTITHIIDPTSPNAPLPISEGNPVLLASGTQVTLLPDGSLDITAASNIAETEVFDYSISDGNGGADNATVTLNRDNDGDGVADVDDLDDDNDGILDSDEGLSYFTTTLDQVSALPASAFISGGGVIPDGTQGLRLSNADGSYALDLYQGPNSSAGAPFTFNTGTGRIQSNEANVLGAGAGRGEVVEIVYTTLNSANPFDLTTISILDIDSLTSGGGATNVRDAYVWSEAGTWTPQGSPAAAVVSVDTAAADAVGDFVIPDPDGNNIIGNIGQFTQVTVIDDTLSDVLLNPAGGGNNHNVEFVFDDAQTTASLFAFNSGGSNMFWGFNPQLDVAIYRPVGLDTDGDGIANHLDLDSDNDGISDLIESGQNTSIVDQNNDGIHDGGVDANGVPIAANGGVTLLDNDNDGIANLLDLDSDNDGIADAVEARPTAGYTSSTHDNNVNNSGVNDDGLYIPVDTDNDGTADYLDLDSDNDVGRTNGGTDAQESGLNAGADNNGDGIGDGVGASYADPDGNVNNPSQDLANQTSDRSEIGFREDNTAPETSGIIDQSGLDAAVTTFDITNSFSDIDSTDVLNYTATGLPTGLSLDPATGIIAGIIDPSASVVGSFPVTVTADDNNGGTVSTSFTWAIVNPAPTAVADEATTDEDTALNATVASNDSDIDGDDLTYRVGSDVSNGTLTFNADGSYTYLPNQDFHGTDSFTYNIDDGEGGIASATVSITVLSVNDTPETTGIAAQSNSDADAITPLDISGSFRDVDGDTLTFSASGLPTGLSLDPATGIISGTIDPSASVSGSFTVTITADDGQGANIATTFTWAIANPAPVAANDSETTDEDTAFNSTVASNDSDLDGDTLVYSVIDDVAHGTLSFNPDGSYHYIPDANFNGEDRFSYQVDDGEGGVATANVIISVTPVNDAPFASGLTDQASNDAQNITPFSIANSFTDIEGDRLTYTASGLPTGLSLDPATGIISGVIDPSASVDAPATSGFDVTITADDGHGGSISTTFQWAVANPAPVADGETEETVEDTSFSSTVANNDSDIDGDGLVWSVETDVSHGTLSFNDDGSYNYQPDPDFNGQDEFTYQVNDGEGGIATASVIITVTPVNDAPIAVNDSITTDENSLISADVTPKTAGQDSDVDLDVLVIQEVNGLAFTSGNPVTLPSGAILTMNTDGSYSYNPNGQFESLADGETARDFFTYRISDGSGGIDTAVVNITITGVNDAPDAVDDVHATDEDTTISGDVTPFGVLGQDSDVERFDILSVAAINGDPLAVGTQITLPSGALLSINADGSYDYSPQGAFDGLAQGETAQDSFVYTLSDGQGGSDTATVVIDITGVNDDVQTTGIADQSGKDADLTTLDITGSFSDPDKTDVLTYTAAGLPTGLTLDPATGIISGTIDPSASVDGSYDVVITADDGKGGALTTGFTWAVANPAPTALNDAETTDEDTAFSSSVAPNDSDPDGDALTYSVLTDAPNGTLVFNADGSYSYTPNQDFNGEDQFTYLVDDGEGGTSAATVVITVVSINDTPETSGIIDQAGKDAGLTEFDISSSFSDVDGDKLTYSATGLPTGLTLDPSTGIISGTIDPSASVDGPYDVVITADDGHKATISTAFTWAVVNPAPTAQDDGETTDEDTAFSSTVAPNDSDPDGDKLAYSVLTDVTSGTLSFNADGTYNYSPGLNFYGEDRFTYHVDDGEGGTSTATVVITVSPVNDTPETSGIIEQSGNDAGVTELDISGSFSDVDGDKLTYSATGLPTGLTLDPATGLISGTIDPSASVDGPYDVVITADDGQGATISSPFTWAVANPAPTAQNDGETTNEDTAFNSTVVANDSDPDGDKLTYTVLATVSNGTLTFNADGSYSYSPNQDFHGEDRFHYQVNDGEGGTSSATVVITINSVNDTPETTGITGQSGKDAGVTELDISGSFSDVDGDILTYSATGLPTGLTLDPKTGVISGTIGSSASVNGSYDVVITADDGQGATISTPFTWAVTNPAPTAINDAETIDEDTSFSSTVAPNDSDPDGDKLTYSIVTDAPNGTLTFNADGSYNYTPNQDFNGEDRFTYQVDDSEGGASTATVIISVTPINDAPVAVDDSYSLDEDATLSGNITPLAAGQDTDVDGDVITVMEINGVAVSVGQQITLPSGALLTVSPDGSYDYNPNSSFNGLAEGETATDSFTYTITDGHNALDTATVTFLIEGSNDNPEAVDDAGQTDQDTAIFGNLTPGTNGQDSDVDTSDVLSVTQINNVDGTTGQQITLPSGALLSVNSDGSYFYTPNNAFDYLAQGEIAQDSFTYTLSDGQGGSDTATVVIDITGKNDDVQTTAIADQSGKDAASTVLDITGSFSDPDKTDVLTYSATGLPTGLTLDPVTGIISGTIDPSASVNGPFSVTVTADDGKGSTETTGFKWAVTNPAPIAQDDSETTDEDTVFNSSVAPNDSDPDGDALTYSVVTDSPNGTLTFNADGSYSYIPNQDFNGEDRFTYLVDDGQGGTSTATVIITVTPVNDAPVAVDDSETLGEDDTVLGDLTAPVQGQDFDVDGDVLTLTHINGQETTPGQTITLPSGALLNVVPDGTYDYNPNGSFNNLAVGETVLDSFSYTITDGNGTVDTATVTFTVLGMNDAPDAVDDTNQTDQNSTISSNLTPNTNGQDSDVDKTDILSVVQINGLDQSVGQQITLPSGALLNVNADGSYSYTPNHAFDGLAQGESTQDSFAYTLSDGQGGNDTAIVVINITGVNDGPVLVNGNTLDDLKGDDAQAITPIDVTATFADPDSSDVLAYTAIGLPEGLTLDPKTGILSGTIDPSASTGGKDGVYSIRVTATDPHGVTVTDSFGWTVSNPAPEATDNLFATSEDSSATNVGNALTADTGNGADSDPDGDKLSIVPQSNVAGTAGGIFAIDAAGIVSFDPAGAFEDLAEGETRDTVMAYTLSDGEGGIDTAQVTITVRGTNDGPVLVSGNTLGDLKGDDAQAITPIDVTATFNDPDNTDVLTYTAIGLPEGLTLDPKTGILFGTIDPSASTGGKDGVYSIRVTATDPHGVTVTDSFDWTVSNPAPEATDNLFAASEDSRATNVGNALTADTGNGADSDPDGDKLSIVPQANITGSTGGIFAIDQAGDVTFDPGHSFTDLAVGQTRDTVMTYTLTDGQDGTDTAQVTVTVTGTNDAPIVIIDSELLDQSGNDGERIEPVDVTRTFVDFDTGDTLTYTAAGLPEGLTLDPKTGILSGTLDSSASGGGENGVYTITVTATDNHGARISDSFEWTVSNPTPIAVTDRLTLNEDGTGTGNVSLNDYDIDGDDLSFTVNTDPGHGRVTMLENGQFTYTPNSDYHGSDSFTYQLTDSDGNSTIQIVHLNVVSVNDSPVVVTQLNDQDHREGNQVSLNIANNFSDLDGDNITYSQTGLPNGLVLDPNTGLVSGTLSASAAQQGIVRVEITAHDNNGGRVSFSFIWSVRPLPVIIEATPYVTDYAPETRSTEEEADRVSIGGASEKFAADGIIVSTLNGLKSLAGTLYHGADQSSLGNGAQSSASLGQMVQRIADITGTSIDSWDSAGLTGFSIKMGTGQDAASRDSSGAKGHLIIETLVRQKTLYIEIKNDLTFEDERKIKNYQVTMANGQPLPSWLKISDKGMLIGERPVHSEQLQLHITAQMDDGSKIEKAVTVRTQNGEITAAQLQTTKPEGAVTP